MPLHQIPERKSPFLIVMIRNPNPVNPRRPNPPQHPLRNLQRRRLKVKSLPNMGMQIQLQLQSSLLISIVCRKWDFLVSLGKDIFFHIPAEIIQRREHLEIRIADHPQHCVIFVNEQGNRPGVTCL